MKRLLVTTCAALMLAGPAEAQLARPTPASVALRCDTTATLEALEGGGRIRLERDKTFRIPYGVRYRFRRRVPDAAAVWLTLELDEGGGSHTVAAQRLPGTDCHEARLPELPLDRGLTLIERASLPLSPTARDSLVEAVNGIRSAFLDHLYGDAYEGKLGSRLRAAVEEDSALFAPLASFREYVVLVPGDGQPVPRPVADTVRALFLYHLTDITALPRLGVKGQALALTLRDIARDSARACRRAELGPDTLALRELVERWRPLAEARDQRDLARAYAGRLLPIAAADAKTVASLIRKSCGEIASLIEGADELAHDPFASMTAALREAQRLIERSYRLVVVDGFGGATTTLQRYGQLEVVNAYFVERREVRLLTTFSLYPGRLRYGGEREPHGLGDRLLISFGYSLATVAEDSSAAGGDKTVFTVGLSLRLNSAVVVGGGIVLPNRRRDHYLSVSLDLGSLEFLRGLLARPESP